MAGKVGYYGSLADDTVLGYKAWRKKWAVHMEGQPLRIIRKRYVYYVLSWRENH